MSRTHAQPGRPLCIVLADGTRLAVPPMRPDLPGDARRQIFDAVLRRQLGLADTLIRIETDLLEGRERKAGHDLARLISQRPNHVELNEAA